MTVYNVTDFPSLQACVDTAQAQGGTEIQLPGGWSGAGFWIAGRTPGTQQNFSLDGPLVIRGLGPALATIDAPSYPTGLVVASGGANVLLTGALALDASAVQAPVCNLIYAQNAGTYIGVSGITLAGGPGTSSGLYTEAMAQIEATDALAFRGSIYSLMTATERGYIEIDPNITLDLTGVTPPADGRFLIQDNEGLIVFGTGWLYTGNPNFLLKYELRGNATCRNRGTIPFPGQQTFIADTARYLGP